MKKHNFLVGSQYFLIKFLTLTGFLAKTPLSLRNPSSESILFTKSSKYLLILICYDIMSIKNKNKSKNNNKS